MISVAIRTIAAMALVLASASPYCARAIERVPFTDDGGLIHVKGTVDTYPASIIVDLGAGLNVVSAELGARTVATTGKYVTLTLTGQRVDLPIGTIGSVSLGEFGVDNHTVGMWKALDGTGVDALISAGAFRDVTTTFDFRQHEIVIEDAASFFERTRFGARVPLLLQDELGIALGVFARFDFGHGQTGLCAIDTGLPGIAIDRRFAAKMGINLSDSSHRPAHTSLGDGVTATIPSLALVGASDTTMADPQVVFQDLVYDCNVGNAFWNGKVFTLDIPHHVMYVAPPG